MGNSMSTRGALDFLVLVSLVAVAVGLVSCTSTTNAPAPATTCGPGTMAENGVCVLTYSPPPTKQLGTGATVYVWETASAGASAQGKVYVIVDGYTQGELTGYAQSGTPSCGENAIYGLAVSVEPGQSYSISAHDQASESWPVFQTPTLTAGQCYAFALN